MLSIVLFRQLLFPAKPCSIMHVYCIDNYQLELRLIHHHHSTWLMWCIRTTLKEHVKSRPHWRRGRSRLFVARAGESASPKTPTTVAEIGDYSRPFSASRQCGQVLSATCVVSAKKSDYRDMSSEHGRGTV